jgi:hypothetical protein
MDMTTSPAITAVWIEVEDTVDGSFGTVRTDDTILHRTEDHGYSSGAAARLTAEQWAKEHGYGIREK